jgi:hypothetical protein
MFLEEKSLTTKDTKVDTKGTKKKTTADFTDLRGFDGQMT